MSSKLEGKWKLSQNHSKERQERVINALEKGDENSKQIAMLMKDNLEN
jgi:transcriptional regulator